MIFDKIENLKKYKGLYEHLDAAVSYIENTDLSKLTTGKTVIDGENLYVNVVEGTLQPEENGVYEFHKQYLDLHIDIVGKERIVFTDLETAELVEEYNPDGDYGLRKGESQAECLIDNSSFCICMTEELHMPMMKVSECESIKKAIFKIKI